MLNGGRGDAIAFAQGAIIIYQYLGDEEQADAARSGGCSLNACDDEMQNILGEIMIA